MKILIIGFPRSRSSILLETISNFYNIPVLGNPINDSDQRKLDSALGKNLLRNISQAPSGVVRFHPLELMNKHDNYKFYNFDLLNFEQYDKIYFTSRESVSDVIASEIVAYTLKRYTYKSTSDLFENITPISITNEHRNLIKTHVHSENLVKTLKQHFEINNIDYESLLYDEIPEYLATNFPDTRTNHIKTNYDYKTIITNYDDILSLYNSYKL
jgi:hypothetical protein